MEVGSGSRGITVFISDPVIGVDVVFPGGPAAGLTALKASATALPLKDGSFDRVVCSDMLEHLGADKRKQAVDELLRVTRGRLFLACPCSSAARRADAFLGRLYRFFRVPVPDWLGEHLQLELPDCDAIRLIFLQKQVDVREIPGEGIPAHLLVSLLIATRAANRFWTKLFQGRPDRAIRLGNSRVLKWGPAYRRLWVVDKT